MKRAYGILLLIVLVLACGCTGTQPENVTPAPSAPAPAATMTVPADGSVLAELSDARPNTSLQLVPGAVVFSFKADGPQVMDVSLMEGTGTVYSEMTEMAITGPFSGSLVFGPPDTAAYRFNVTGNGTWTGRLAVPDCTHPLSAPVNMSGTGVAVSPCLALEKGAYIFDRNGSGFPAPVFELRFANGSVVLDAANTCALPCLGPGAPRQFAIMEVPAEDSYFLSIIPRESPSPWNVSISAVPAIPQMGPGPALTQGT